MGEKYLEDNIKAFLCLDCKADTITEYYMVKDIIWLKANPKRKGMLCINCLEKRLKHRLTSEDFTGCPLNKKNVFQKSPLLQSRLKNKKK
jgi:hypothetical protein